MRARTQMCPLACVYNRAPLVRSFARSLTRSLADSVSLRCVVRAQLARRRSCAKANERRQAVCARVRLRAYGRACVCVCVRASLPVGAVGQSNSTSIQVGVDSQREQVRIAQAAPVLCEVNATRSFRPNALRDRTYATPLCAPASNATAHIEARSHTRGGPTRSHKPARPLPTFAGRRVTIHFRLAPKRHANNCHCLKSILNSSRAPKRVRSARRMFKPPSPMTAVQQLSPANRMVAIIARLTSRATNTRSQNKQQRQICAPIKARGMRPNHHSWTHYLTGATTIPIESNSECSASLSSAFVSLHTFLSFYLYRSRRLPLVSVRPIPSDECRLRRRRERGKRK